MIIESLSIQNIKSIGEEINLNFEKGLNILIGANGSGKSNTMDTLNIAVNAYFLSHWHEHYNQAAGTTRYERRNLNNFFGFPQHEDIKNALSQKLAIKITFSEDDVSNISNLRTNLGAISEKEKNLSKIASSEIYDRFHPIFSNVSDADLEAHLSHVYFIEAQNLNPDAMSNAHSSMSKEQLLFFFYLNYFEKIKYILEKYNIGKSDREKLKEFRYPLKFFSANRFHEGQDFSITTHGQNRTDKFQNLKEKTSKQTTSDIEYSTFFFASKYNNLDRNEALFNEDGDVKLAKKLLKIIGDYDFQVETENKADNRYSFKIKSGEKLINFSDLSSGEKEVFNLIFSICALGLQNAVMIVDEPEIHLHPQWQKVLISLYRELAKSRNLQFILSTHSPSFVDSETIANIVRIYKKDRKTKVVPSKKDAAWKASLGGEKDLIDIITYSNNAKLFFTDTVVLVEGVTDEIIFSYLLEKMNEKRKNIEVVSVDGKEKFNKYVNFLKKFEIKTIVVGDLDCLWQGKLLSNVPIVAPIRGAIASKLEADFTDLEQYLKPNVLRDVSSRKDVGERILEVLHKVRSGESIDADRAFIEHWLTKAINAKAVLLNQNIQTLYSSMPEITNLEKLFQKLEEGVEIDGVNCPIFLLKEGCLENYCEGTGHTTAGSLEFLAKLKTYLESANSDNPKFENLKKIAKDFLEFS